MTFAEYQQAAVRTAREYPDHGFGALVYALGLVGEAGEVGEVIKKQVGHGHEPDKARVADELGDVLWYAAVLAYHYGIRLADVAEANVAKLVARYPAGFAVERSVNRG